jgi:hypothetical protein
MTKRPRRPKQDETEYLLSNPANARRLRESIAQTKAGQVIEETLEDLLEMERPRRKSKREPPR